MTSIVTPPSDISNQRSEVLYSPGGGERFINTSTKGVLGALNKGTGSESFKPRFEISMSQTYTQKHTY